YAVHEFFPFIPTWVYILVFGTIVIPLNWFGIKQLDKLQKRSLQIFFVFLGAAIIMSLFVTPDFNGNFLTYLPEGVEVGRSEEHTSELQSRFDLVCSLLLDKNKRANF